jgi:hypothetical protein
MSANKVLCRRRLSSSRAAWLSPATGGASSSLIRRSIASVIRDRSCINSRNLRDSRKDSATSCSVASTDLGSSGGGLNSRDAPHNHAVAKMIANNPLPSGSFHEFASGLASVTLRVIFEPKIPNRVGTSTMLGRSAKG